MAKYILITFAPSTESYSRGCLMSSSKEELTVQAWNNKKDLYAAMAANKYAGFYLTVITNNNFTSDDDDFYDFDCDNIPKQFSDFEEYYIQYEENKKAEEEVKKKIEMDCLAVNVAANIAAKEIEELKKLQRKYPDVK